MSGDDSKGDVRGTVLVVDDNNDFRRLLRLWLERHGCRLGRGPHGRHSAAGEPC